MAQGERRVDQHPAPAVGSELLRPQTSPSCSAIWTVKLISEGVLGRPCEMRHRTNANSFLNPQGGGNLLYPRLTYGCGMHGGTHSSLRAPATALSELHMPKVTLERQLYMMNPQGLLQA